MDLLTLLGTLYLILDNLSYPNQYLISMFYLYKQKKTISNNFIFSPANYVEIKI